VVRWPGAARYACGTTVPARLPVLVTRSRSTRPRPAAALASLLRGRRDAGRDGTGGDGTGHGDSDRAARPAGSREWADSGERAGSGARIGPGERAGSPEQISA
jgi:hypothetical protein